MGMITKSLKFNHVEADNIKKGLQTATLRIRDEKDIAVDDKVYIIDKVQESNPKTWRVCGTATIDQVKIQRVGDLNLNGAHFEQFGSTAELYKQLQMFYGDPIDETTHVKVISFTFRPFDEEKKVEYIEEKNTTQVTEVKLYGDGGSRGNPGPSASGYVIMDMTDKILETNGEYLNVTTNNQAEYHSLKIGLERSKQLGVKVVHVYMDSLLVINQLKGLYKVKNRELMQAYLHVKSLASSFVQVDYTHVPRELNRLADAEVNRILDSIEK
jgi:ribonuclease HI